ncbi:transcription elongation factor S-II [Lingula anatina]|uniref:Transcription elongation factor n=1 Tax=Lingula anatina TaxID=7574 RepID=A0A1S3HWR0_LINAN|nr:transcription elongation factor S-II-like [Lingula anatina]XP_013418728.1 transcription elongation factor S-II [Lingula anatina]|eukprot:XP_013390453.1 transcription elongation factor S-II-like [Lingula anatina]
MSAEEEVTRIGKKLEKMIDKKECDHASAVDILKVLKEQRMRLEVLQKTRIGMIVNNFRKASTNDEVITLSKSLIKSWKKLLPADQSTAKNSSSKPSTDGSGDHAEKANSEKSSTSEPSTPTAAPKQTSFPLKAADTTDSVRLKCRELLLNALKVEDPPEGAGDPDEIAVAIEDCIFAEFGNTEMKYKSRVRSRIANLKDKKNPQLRENVLCGYILPEKMAKMTAEEMASEDMKKLRAKLTKEAINDHQMATTSGTKTDLLKCGRCLKRNCTYNQVQTRSADEPMTTFVFCNECGHRWKFC